VPSPRAAESGYYIGRRMYDNAHATNRQDFQRKDTVVLAWGTDTYSVSAVNAAAASSVVRWTAII